MENKINLPAQHIHRTFCEKNSEKTFAKNLFPFVLVYELKIIFRQPFSWCNPLLFFVIITSLFPLALGPDTELLTQIAPCIFWVAALLAILISIGQIFNKDEEEGFLDILLLTPNTLSLIVFQKILCHWLLYCVPLIVVSPVLGSFLHLNLKQDFTLFISLLLGTPVFCFIGAIGAALMIGIKTHGLILPIIMTPFYFPVLIFGSSSVAAAAFQQPVSGYFAILGALMIFSIIFAIPLTSIALRIGANE